MRAARDIFSDPDEFDAVEAPLFYIETKDADPTSEEDRQRVALADLRKVAPAILAYANVNAAKRTLWAAQKAKREGMLPGVTDLTLAWSGGCAWPEFKNGQVTFPLKSKPTDRAQVAFMNALVRQGHNVGVFRTSAGLITKLAEWGAPLRVAAR